jgi:ribosomal protein L37AE/L43A
MLALIITPQRFVSLRSRVSERLPSIEFDQSLTNQHCCPCCSYVLLRHIRHGNVYWRCSHCHDSMPAWSLGRGTEDYAELN